MDLNIEDVAEILRVSEATVRRWLADGKIPAYKIHSQYRFDRVEIENWMMSCRFNKGDGAPLPFSEKQVYSKEMEGMAHFDLYRAIHHGEVFTDPVSTDKEALITAAVKRMAPLLDVDEEALLEGLFERERLMPTGLGLGIAVPHTRDFLLQGLNDIVGIVYPNKPISWGALDGQDVHTVFFLLASSDRSHLRLLAKIAHLTSSALMREVLAKKYPKDKLLEQVKAWEQGLSR